MASYLQIEEETPQRMVVRVRPFITYFFWGGSIALLLFILITGIVGLIVDYSPFAIYLNLVFLALLIINSIVRARKINLAMLDKRQGLMTVSSAIPIIANHTKVTYPLDEVASIESRYGADELHFILRNGKHIPFADGGYEKAKARHQRVAGFLGVQYVDG